MALSQDNLDAIDAAIASGQLRLTFDGRTVEYRSIDDLIKARAHVARIVSGAASGATRTAPRHQLASFADD